MEVDRTYTQETTKHHHPSSHHMEPPQGRDEEVGHETPGRDTEKETKEMGYTRKEMEKMATDRKRWHSLVDGLCSQRANRYK